MKRLSNAMLATWLVGTLALGKAFASLGAAPVYVPDALAIGGVALSLPRWWPYSRLPPIRVLRMAALIIAALAVQSIVRGYALGYPAALKSGVLAVYPLVAVAVAGLVAREPTDLDRMTRLLPLVPLGFWLVLLFMPGTLIPAAFGLYLACVAAFAVSPRIRGRRRLGLLVLAGALGLAIAEASRGPTLAIICGLLGSYIAAGRFGRRRGSATGIIATCTVVALAATLVLVVSVTNLDERQLPAIGSLVGRTLDTGRSGSQASNNVALRQMMWNYALHTTAERHPWIGQGAGHYVEVSFAGNDINGKDTGVHNSFVGYTFYAGYPCGALVVLLFLMALLNSWRARWLHPYGAAIFGCVVAGTITAMTNVALETPYIAGPTWAAVGAAFGVRAATLRTGSSDRHPPVVPLLVRRRGCVQQANGLSDKEDRVCEAIAR